MSKVYFISDTHFGHKNITNHRKSLLYSTMEEHDEFVLDNILSTVSKRDTLWILGDIAFSVEAFNEYVLKIADRVTNLNVIFGNHDMDSGARPNPRLYNQRNIRTFGLFKYKKAWLSHGPIHPAELRGKFNIHGHVHYASIDDPRYINVCVESPIVMYKPVTWQQILETKPIETYENLQRINRTMSILDEEW